MEEDNLTIAEAAEFYGERVDEQKELEDGTEVPAHGEALVVDDAAELLTTVQQVEMGVDLTDDGEGVTDEEREAMAEAAANVVTSVFVLAHERDLDLAETIGEQMDFIEAMMEFNEAAEDADGEAEMRAAMDEHLTEEMMEMMGVAQQPTIGSNVDADEYDGDTRAFQ